MPTATDVIDKGSDMKKRRTAKEIKEMLVRGEAQVAQGTTVEQVCSDLAVSVPTYYLRRRKYAEGAGEGDPKKRIKELETENSRLRRVVTDQAMEIVRLKEDLGQY